MSRTWILVAHRSGARLFENRGPGKGLAFVRNIDNPAGKLKSHELNGDKPGRNFDRRGRGRHAYETEHSPTMHVAEVFAKQLATLLDEGRLEQRYQRLVLVAEPRFLGLLRGSLPETTAGLVSASVDKDLGGTEARDLPRYLEDVVYV
jgi:protein required for attachment to host cells